MDVALAHPEVQVAHQQLSRSRCGESSHSAAAVAVPAPAVHVVVPLPVGVAALEALVPTCGSASASELSPRSPTSPPTTTPSTSATSPLPLPAAMMASKLMSILSPIFVCYKGS